MGTGLVLNKVLFL